MVSIGCGSGETTGDAGSGGSAGTGGTPGAGGEGGTGGLRVVSGTGTYVFASPIPPCEEGVASNYSVEAVLGGAGVLIPSFPECTGIPAGEDATITCPVDEQALDYSIKIYRGGGSPGGERLDVEATGAFEACGGFLFRDVHPPPGVADIGMFVSPVPPCQRGVPSEYTVHLFADGAPLPLAVEGSFPDCGGVLDSDLDPITCSNAGDSLPYSITIGVGDLEVSFNGAWETCTAFLAR